MKFFRCALIFLFSLLLFSCAESVADVVSASSTTIFDFADSENPPEQRLAVFLQVTNEVQRTDSFKISHDKTGYVWNVIKPGIFTGQNKSYAFSLNLNAPECENIPEGEYTVTYFDAAGNEDSVKFTVTYKKELISSNSQNVKALLQGATENIAIYDDSGELLFMGKPKNTWASNEIILKDYKLAESKRLCYVTSGNTIICMLPAEKLKSGE